MPYKYTLEVTMSVADQVDQQTLTDFAEDALGNWGGQCHPDDELFSVNISSVEAIPQVESVNQIELGDLINFISDVKGIPYTEAENMLLQGLSYWHRFS